ncbi:MAG TPA: hypothetical protein VK654_00005 [Nitrospirota bacterium]|nr:hypothetical protein [Nitrospirota bacterium]
MADFLNAVGRGRNRIIGCFGIRRPQNGYFFRRSMNVFIGVLFLVVSPVPAQSSDQASEKKIIYRMYEMRQIIESGLILAPPDLRTLDEVKRNALKNELMKINTSQFPTEEKRDLDEWRESMVAVLDNPPASASDSVAPAMRIWTTCMAVLADYNITGAMARADGFPVIADSVDRLQVLAKEMFFAKLSVNIETLEELPPVSRALVEYLSIYTILAGPEHRDPRARNALLLMKPEEIRDTTARSAFVELHTLLLLLPHGANDKSKPSMGDSVVQGGPLFLFCKLLKINPIEDAEFMYVTTDDNFLNFVKKLREISKKDNCGVREP